MSKTQFFKELLQSDKYRDPVLFYKIKEKVSQINNFEDILALSADELNDEDFVDIILDVESIVEGNLLGDFQILVNRSEISKIKKITFWDFLKTFLTKFW